jgi:hypothetical protein
MNSYTAPSFSTAPYRTARSIELVFGGIEMAGQSFEGRIFLNNPAADDRTPQTPEMGYAGSFYVYGYGDPPPPAIAEAKRRHIRGSGPIAPIEKRVRVDAETFGAAVERSDKLTVTVVPIPVGDALPERPFERVDIVVHRSGD